MKGVFTRLCLCTLISLSFGTLSVFASPYYINKNGVEMTELQYNKMLSIFSDKKVSLLSQDEFDSIKNANIIASGAVYEKTTYVNGEFHSSEIITKEEYDSASTANVSPNTRDSDDSFIETSYKRLYASMVDLENRFQLIANLHWKKMPACRSYDVFAYRFTHFDYSGFTGQQVYSVGSNDYIIDYTTSSEGYKAQSNGAGVSMNLKDGSNITGYDLTVVTTLTVNTDYYAQAHAYISYQHAQSDVTRAQSMDYVLNISGLGSVVDFNNATTSNKYDGMSGLHLTTPINQ